jgi:hypothetical protein
MKNGLSVMETRIAQLVYDMLCITKTGALYIWQAFIQYRWSQ